MQGGYLQNVITFPPDGSFVVNSSVSPVGQQRVDFQFNAAALNLPEGRRLGLPPFGKGWCVRACVGARGASGGGGGRCWTVRGLWRR